MPSWAKRQEARVIVLRVSAAEALLPNEASPDDLLRRHGSQAMPVRVLDYSAAPYLDPLRARYPLTVRGVRFVFGFHSDLEWKPQREVRAWIETSSATEQCQHLFRFHQPPRIQGSSDAKRKWSSQKLA